MNLRKKVQQDIKTALKQSKKNKLSYLRYLFAQIKNEEIKKGRQKLTNQEIISIFKKQKKIVQENLELYQQKNRQDLIEKSKKELQILNEYLPKQLSEKDLEEEIKKILAQNPQISQPGPLIGIAIKKLSGQADNSLIAKKIREVLEMSS